MRKRYLEATRILPYIQKGIQNLGKVDALEIKTVYPKWEKLVELGQVEYDESGFKFVYMKDGFYELYECREANPTFQADWVPGINTSAIYVRISEGEEGTSDSPITATRGLKYINGLYYLDPEDMLIYLCDRQDAEDGEEYELAYLPHELIGHYFVLA